MSQIARLIVLAYQKQALTATQKTGGVDLYLLFAMESINVRFEPKFAVLKSENKESQRPWSLVDTLAYQKYTEVALH